MTDPAAVLRQGAAGPAPATVTLMRALIVAEAPEAVDRAFASLADTLAPDAAARLDAVARLWAAHRGAWAVVREVAGAADHAAEARDPASAVATWAAVFDRLAATAPDAGVALYGLGDPALTARATAEVVERLDGWGLLGPDRDALDLGCGSGRFLRALAPRLRGVTGLDVSAGMVAEARRRCAGLANTRVARTDGRGLAPVGDGAVDLVLAADVFPYLVGAGGPVAADHLREAARVLRAGGALVILNWSYRGDVARDRAEVLVLAARHGFAATRVASGDFALWDGSTFHLTRLR